MGTALEQRGLEKCDGNEYGYPGASYEALFLKDSITLD